MVVREFRKGGKLFLMEGNFRNKGILLFKIIFLFLNIVEFIIRIVKVVFYVVNFWVSFR